MPTENNGHLYRWDWVYNIGDTVGHGEWVQLQHTLFKSTWRDDFEYEPGDIVSSFHKIIINSVEYDNNATFICIANNINHEPPIAVGAGGDSYWQLIGITYINM